MTLAAAIAFTRAAYTRLVALLDQGPSRSGPALVVDLWFVDAYWKLGMLYLDVENYRNAALELAKVALAPQHDARAREQLYAYLAESFFYLGDRPAADWFAQRTLEINPRNEYVLRFRASR